MSAGREEVSTAALAFACLAGWSFVLTVLSAAFVAPGMIGIALEVGEADWGALGSCIFLYGAVWIVSASHGVGEAFDEQVIRPPRVLGVLLALRAALCAVGLCWSLWGGAGHWQAGLALVMAGSLLGAVVEGVCSRRVADVLGVAVWSAVRISLRCAGKGTRRGLQGGRIA